MAVQILNIQQINQIKVIVVKSLASDDELLEMLVLKGGNAISLGYGLSDRPSYDLDYSLEHDFEDLKEIETRLQKLLEEGFAVNGYVCFDFEFQDKPKTQTHNFDFWGGYNVTFKLISEVDLVKINRNLDEARSKYAIRVNRGGSPKFSIDISRHEYIDSHKVDTVIDGMHFYVYAPELIVAEKIRALCQKLPEYTAEILKQSAPDREKARARDFYDIYVLTEYFPFKWSSPEFISLVKNVFDAKRVPYGYLKRIRSMKEVHRQDFESVKATVTDRELTAKGFDFFFDDFLKKFENALD